MPQNKTQSHVNITSVTKFLRLILIVHRSVSPFAYLLAHPSIRPFLNAYVHPSVRRSHCPSIFHPFTQSVSQSVSQSMSQSVSLSVSLTVDQLDIQSLNTIIKSTRQLACFFVSKTVSTLCNNSKPFSSKSMYRLMS